MEQRGGRSSGGQLVPSSRSCPACAGAKEEGEGVPARMPGSQLSKRNKTENQTSPKQGNNPKTPGGLIHAELQINDKLYFSLRMPHAVFGIYLDAELLVVFLKFNS